MSSLVEAMDQNTLEGSETLDTKYRWIKNGSYDLKFIIFPIFWITLIMLTWYLNRSMGWIDQMTYALILWSIFYFIFSMPHFSGTLTRMWYDPEFYGKHKGMLWAVPLGLVGAGLSCLVIGEVGKSMGIFTHSIYGLYIWVYLYYFWGTYHVAKQHIGFTRIYTFKNREVESPFDKKLDTFIIYGIPIAAFSCIFVGPAFYARNLWYTNHLDLSTFYQTSVIKQISFNYWWAVNLFFIFMAVGYAFRQFQVHQKFGKINLPKVLTVYFYGFNYWVAGCLFGHTLIDGGGLGFVGAIMLGEATITWGHAFQYDYMLLQFNEKKYFRDEKPNYLFDFLKKRGVGNLLGFWGFILISGNLINLMSDTYIYRLLGVEYFMVDPLTYSAFSLYAVLMVLKMCHAYVHYTYDSFIWRMNYSEDVAMDCKKYV